MGLSEDTLLKMKDRHDRAHDALVRARDELIALEAERNAAGKIWRRDHAEEIRAGIQGSLAAVIDRLVKRGEQRRT